MDDDASFGFDDDEHQIRFVCASCRSTSYMRNAAGAVVCSDCGVRSTAHETLEGGEAFESQLLRQDGRVEKRKVYSQTRVKEEKLVQHPAELFSVPVFLQCVQQILRQQVAAASAKWQLPSAFSASVRELWLLYIEQWVVREIPIVKVVNGRLVTPGGAMYAGDILASQTARAAKSPKVRRTDARSPVTPTPAAVESEGASEEPTGSPLVPISMQLLLVLLFICGRRCRVPLFEADWSAAARDGHLLYWNAYFTLSTAHQAVMACAQRFFCPASVPRPAMIAWLAESLAATAGVPMPVANVPLQVRQLLLRCNCPDEAWPVALRIIALAPAPASANRPPAATVHQSTVPWKQSDSCTRVGGIACLATMICWASGCGGPLRELSVGYTSVPWSMSSRDMNDPNALSSVIEILQTTTSAVTSDLEFLHESLDRHYRPRPASGAPAKASPDRLPPQSPAPPLSPGLWHTAEEEAEPAPPPPPLEARKQAAAAAAHCSDGDWLLHQSLAVDIPQVLEALNTSIQAPARPDARVSRIRRLLRFRATPAGHSREAPITKTWQRLAYRRAAMSHWNGQVHIEVWELMTRVCKILECSTTELLHHIRTLEKLMRDASVAVSI